MLRIAILLVTRVTHWIASICLAVGTPKREVIRCPCLPTAEAAAQVRALYELMLVPDAARRVHNLTAFASLPAAVADAVQTSSTPRNVCVLQPRLLV